MAEPFIGYGLSGDLTSRASDSSIGAQDLGGPSLGVRAGWESGGATVGAEFRYNPYKAVSGSVETDADVNSFGLYAAYRLPVLFRGWIGYAFSHKMKLKTATETELSGRNFSIGIGYTGLPFLSLNIEYHTATYTDLEQGSTKTELEETEDNLLMFSVSAPLDIPIL